MPKICRFESRKSGTKFTGHVYYSPKDNIFYVKLTDDYIDFVENKKVKDLVQHFRIGGKNFYAVFGNTRDEAEESTHTYLLEFGKHSRTVRKIIAYKLQYSEGERGTIRKDDFWNDKFEYNKAEISIEFIILEETKMGKSVNYYTTDKDRDRVDIDNDDFHIIDYTPDRESFFEKLRSALVDLSEQIDEFLGEEKKLCKAIDSGTLMLPSIKKGKK